MPLTGNGLERGISAVGGKEVSNKVCALCFVVRSILIVGLMRRDCIEAREFAAKARSRYTPAKRPNEKEKPIFSDNNLVGSFRPRIISRKGSSHVDACATRLQ